jgi:hypothetical protein
LKKREVKDTTNYSYEIPARKIEEKSKCDGLLCRREDNIRLYVKEITPRNTVFCNMSMCILLYVQRLKDVF